MESRDGAAVARTLFDPEFMDRGAPPHGKVSSVQSVVSKHRRGVGVEAKSWKKVQNHENLV